MMKYAFALITGRLDNVYGQACDSCLHGIRPVVSAVTKNDGKIIQNGPER